ncbi:MAG TPA: hypothetical protein V6C81_13425 [Planktothrix sp.]
MNTQVTHSEQTFAFVPRQFSLDDAMDIVDEALEKANIRSTSGERLYERHVNVQALAQRIVSNDEFDMDEFVALLDTRYGVEKLNQALVGDCSTENLITGFHHLFDQRVNGVADERVSSRLQ